MDKHLEPAEKQRRITIILVSVIAFVTLTWFLQVTYTVTMPLALAFFVMVTLRPIQKWLGDRLPKRLHWLSLVAAMLVFLAVVAAGIGSFWFVVNQVGDKAPEYAPKLQQSWSQVTQWAKDHNLPVQGNLLNPESARQKVTHYVGQGVKTVISLVGLITLVFFLVLLMLLETHNWKHKSEAAFRGRNAEEVFQTVDAVAYQVREYLLIRTVLGVISGVAAALFLWAIGVEFPYLWGLLAFVLNYIPNIGSIIAVFPPVLMALLQFGPGKALLTLAGLAALEQIIGNYIDPRVSGKKMSISPIVVLVSVLFWGWIWGTVGAIIGVPLTASIIIICSHIKALRPVALMLSNAESAGELRQATEPHSGK